MPSFILICKHHKLLNFLTNALMAILSWLAQTEKHRTQDQLPRGILQYLSYSQYTVAASHVTSSKLPTEDKNKTAT